MKKIFILTLVLSSALAISAQSAKESLITFGKQQLSGYIIDIPNADVSSADAAFRDKLENRYNLKGTKESGFRAYLNQPFAPFGTANYDIYYTVSEYGKKKNRTTQLSLIVCTGNMNAISSQNDPGTADYILVFLNDFVNYIDTYNLQQKATSLEDQITKLNKEKNDLEKSQSKVDKQIDKLNKEKEEYLQKVQLKNEEIEKMKSELNDVQKSLR